MFRFVAAAVTVAVLAAPVPAVAQSIGDIGRAIQQQILPRQEADPRQGERDRAIYEQGRGDRRRFEKRWDKRHGNAHRREENSRYEQNRYRGDGERFRHE